MDLKNLGIDPHHALLKESVHLIGQTEKREDGGIGPGKSIRISDVCVNGMFLNYASYFGETESELRSIVDFLIGQQMADGGFNCFSNRRGAKHSSLHSTISVLEGFCEYRKNGYGYRVAELDRIAEDCVRFILLHRLCRSDRTGEIINPDFLKLPHPWRWKYNILRALDGFRSCAVPWDDRMQDAVDELARRRSNDGRWRCHGSPSRRCARHHGKSWSARALEYAHRVESLVSLWTPVTDAFAMLGQSEEPSK